MKTLKYISGTIFMIPIEPPRHTYGRVLLDGFIEVFDCKTEIAIQNMEEIIACPKLFKVTDGA